MVNSQIQRSNSSPSPASSSALLSSSPPSSDNNNLDPMMRPGNKQSTSKMKMMKMLGVTDIDSLQSAVVTNASTSSANLNANNTSPTGTKTKVTTSIHLSIYLLLPDQY